jgi:hypothetical protein
MSNDKAIAAVTATLQQRLQRQLSAELPGAKVSTAPPDRARPAGADGPQLNLFLYRTSIDAAWRNQPPIGTHPADAGLPALPLVLSYLLTAYGDNDDEIQSHRILGVAMSSLNDKPLLPRSAIATAFPGSDLESQVERVRITPHPIPMDEISRLWATFQTGYRISVSYDVAVVLIDSTEPSRSGPPVLARGADDQGPIATTAFPPQIDKVVLPRGMPAARPGDLVHLVGRHLETVTSIEATCAHLSRPQTLPVTERGSEDIAFTVPVGGTLLPAGTALLTPLAPTPEARGNTVALRLAPTLLDGPFEASLVGGAATVPLSCSPPVQEGQTIQLIVGDRIVRGATPQDETSDLTFELSEFKAGQYLVRLRVDDQDSIPIDVNDPLAFDEHQFLVLT